MFKFKGPINGR